MLTVEPTQSAGSGGGATVPSGPVDGSVAGSCAATASTAHSGRRTHRSRVNSSRRQHEYRPSVIGCSGHCPTCHGCQPASVERGGVRLGGLLERPIGLRGPLPEPAVQEAPATAAALVVDLLGGPGRQGERVERVEDRVAGGRPDPEEQRQQTQHQDAQRDQRDHPEAALGLEIRQQVGRQAAAFGRRLGGIAHGGRDQIFQMRGYAGSAGRCRPIGPSGGRRARPSRDRPAHLARQPDLTRQPGLARRTRRPLRRPGSDLARSRLGPVLASKSGGRT